MKHTTASIVIAMMTITTTVNAAIAPPDTSDCSCSDFWGRPVKLLSVVAVWVVSDSVLVVAVVVDVVVVADDVVVGVVVVVVVVDVAEVVVVLGMVVGLGVV